MKNEDEQMHVEVEMPTYSAIELHRFGEFLDNYRRDTPNCSINMEEAMVGFGAMSKKENAGVMAYSIVLTLSGTDRDGRRNQYERPTKFDLFMHKYNAWAWRQFLDAEKLKDYEKMAGEQVEAVAEDKANF